RWSTSPSPLLESPPISPATSSARSITRTICWKLRSLSAPARLAPPKRPASESASTREKCAVTASGDSLRALDPQFPRPFPSAAAARLRERRPTRLPIAGNPREQSRLRRNALMRPKHDPPVINEADLAHRPARSRRSAALVEKVQEFAGQ